MRRSERHGRWPRDFRTFSLLEPDGSGKARDVGDPKIAAARLAVLQAYFDSLQHAAPASRANATAAVKSLLSFAQEIGYLRFNVGKVVKAPPVKNALAERLD